MEHIVTMIGISASGSSSMRNATDSA